MKRVRCCRRLCVTVVGDFHPRKFPSITTDSTNPFEILFSFLRIFFFFLVFFQLRLSRHASQKIKSGATLTIKLNSKPLLFALAFEKRICHLFVYLFNQTRLYLKITAILFIYLFFLYLLCSCPSANTTLELFHGFLSDIFPRSFKHDNN